ncbi:MarR family winged helix-turn-helix transcriptional regulator [Pseudonocardia nantongensis]|uniref:MarR family winged helix-turn-helix transcriptional regulator n=1 Tax=Pseudonocardia nantongensis TaxID=1181885 RepID=UPI00397CD9A9
MQAESPPADEPVPTLLSLFRHATRQMAGELLSRLAEAGYEGITLSAHLVFESLPPGGARLTSVAARIGMTHQAAGEVVSDLVLRGFLARVPDPADRRARLVVLTDDGRRLVRVALAEIAVIERSWLDGLAAAGLSGDLRATLRTTAGAGRSADRPRPGGAPDRHPGTLPADPGRPPG